MKKHTMTYQNLYEQYGEGDYEVPYPVNDEIFIRTPTGKSKILAVIKKRSNVIRVCFEDDEIFECSENHVFSCDGETVLAKNAKTVDTIHGKKRVDKIIDIGEEDVFDISIESPHWYIAKESSGLIHHNTFFVLTTMKEFLTKDHKAIVILFESESALSKSMLENFGIDTKRVMVIPVETVERFRHQCLSLLIKYGEQPESERRKMLIVLDSLGMLSTEKEMGDITEGKDTKDMTRAQIIKAAFRVLTLKLGKLGVPFLLTNHAYQTMCLAEDTEIIMADDTTKNLKDINVGEFVKTRFGERKVLKKYTNEELQNDEDMFEIEMEDGSLIKCTGNHSFIRKGIWVEAKFLKEGDELLCD